MDNPTDDINKAWELFLRLIDYTPEGRFKRQLFTAFEYAFYEGLGAHKAQTGWCFDMDKAPKDEWIDVAYKHKKMETVSIRSIHIDVLRDYADRDLSIFGYEPYAWQLPPSPPKKPHD